MRKLFMILTLAVSTLALSSAASAAYDPPDCYGCACVIAR